MQEQKNAPISSHLIWCTCVSARSGLEPHSRPTAQSTPVEINWESMPGRGPCPRYCNRRPVTSSHITQTSQLHHHYGSHHPLGLLYHLEWMLSWKGFCQSLWQLSQPPRDLKKKQVIGIPQTWCNTLFLWWSWIVFKCWSLALVLLLGASLEPIFWRNYRSSCMNDIHSDV